MSQDWYLSSASQSMAPGAGGLKILKYILKGQYLA